MKECVYMSINPNIYLQEQIEGKLENKKKRQRVEKSLQETTKVLLPADNVPASSMTLQVQSSDKTKSYPVTIHYDAQGIRFECSCGDQFGMTEKRNNCKHVATAILDMNRSFVDTHVSGGKIKPMNKDTVSEIISLLEKFEID
jgi:hypothetical protein